MLKSLLVVVVALSLQEGQAAPTFVTPADVPWKEAPPSLPKGAQIAMLDGDPSKEGAFTFRVKIPAGYKIPPHFHPVDEQLTVVSGVFYVALGETFDPSKAKELKAGSYMKMPARTRHFAWVKEETVFQLSATGPWGVQYVNPADDPRKQ